MNQDMFKDITKALRTSDMRDLVKLALKHADDNQQAKLYRDFPMFYKLTKTGRVMLQPAKKATISKRTLEMMDKSVKGIKAAKAAGTETVSYTAVLGGYGHEAAAQRECQQFLHPNVFIYQSAIFPEPRTHGVVVKVTSVKPVKLVQPSSPLYPWGVELTLSITGPSLKVAHWMNGFQARTRMQVAR